MALRRRRQHHVIGPRAKAQKRELGELHIELARLGFGEDRHHLAIGHLAHGKGLGEDIDPFPLYAIP